MSKLELLLWALMPAIVFGAESCGMDGLCGAESDVMLQSRQNVERHLEVQPAGSAPPIALQTSQATQFPDQFFTCGGTKKQNVATGTPARNDALYTKVQTAVSDVFDAVQGGTDACDNDVCPMADFLGCTLRMAGHDFMDGRMLNGVFNGLGADGCIDMADHDNDGLMPCMASGEFGVNLNTAYGQVCTEVSLADFFVIAGETAIFTARNLAVSNPNVKNGAIQPSTASGAFDLGTRGTGFKFGRVTSATCPVCCTPDASSAEPTVAGQAPRLPGGMHGCNEVDRVFVKGLDLTWRQATALMGVHTLGRASQANSPFDGPWSELPQQMRWNNNYYYSLIAKGWVPAHTLFGGEKKHAYWIRSDSGGSHNRNIGQHEGGREMMLDTDMCLFWSVTDARPFGGNSATQDVQALRDVQSGASNSLRTDSVDALKVLQHSTIGGCCLWAASDNNTVWPQTIFEMVNKAEHLDKSGIARHCNDEVPFSGTSGSSHGAMHRKCCERGAGTTTQLFKGADFFNSDCTSVLWHLGGVKQKGNPQKRWRIPMGRGNRKPDTSAALDYAMDETEWLDDFETVWRKVTEMNAAFQ